MKVESIEDIYELSPLQEGMLFHTLLTPGSGMYFEQVGFGFTGPLNVQAFEHAWQTVLDRHTILRTSFHWDNPGKPLQVVHRSVSLRVEYLDWSDLPGDTCSDRLDAFLAADRARGFELSEAPLLRLTVIAKPANETYIVLSLHHLLLDGWSSALVYQEAGALYEACCSGEPLSLPPCRPFGDYIAWLQKQDLFLAEAYWRKRLAGYQGAPPLGTGLAPSPQHRQTQFEVCEARIKPVTTDALRQLAVRHQLTLNTIAQGAWALLLSRYSGEEDVVFGATASGRPAELDGVESMVGLFINTLPVRVRVPGHLGLAPWLRELQGDQLDARSFEHTPLVQVHAWSDAARKAPLFETLLAFENFPAGSRSSDTSLEYRTFTRTNYPLSLSVVPGAGWALKLIYATPRFAGREMRRLLGHFEQILSSMAADPHRRLSSIDLPTRAESRQFSDWNDTATAYARDSTVHRLFEEQARRTPDSIAVSFGQECLTYDELNRRASQLSHLLREQHVRAETVVGVCVESPIDFAVSMLAILKAGGAYLPLDPAYPDERLRFMLEDSRAVAIVTRQSHAPKRALEDRPVLILESLDHNAPELVESLQDVTTAENIAYVMYTSGSTGRPKGASIPHRAVIRTVRNTNYLAFGPAQVVAQMSSFSFDAVTFEFWGALLNGGRVAGIAKSVALSPDGLADALRAEHVTSAFVTTDLFNSLVRERPGIFSPVENLLTGGSALNTTWIAACLREGPPRRLLNVYGPTESTTFASWQLISEIPESARTVPIGRPVSNTQIHVLDRQLAHTPVGVAGEIYIGGDGLARGYLNRPDTTAEKFLPDPFSTTPGARLYRTGDKASLREDGAIEFLGRLDDQVKLRGFRVEVGEIEAVLRAQPEVHEAVVVVREDVAEAKRLVAYVVPADARLTSADLRRALETALPDYMVPSAFILRDALPLMPNGKVDRRALATAAERPAAEEHYAEPTTPAEKTLAEIWSQVLSLKRVGIHDNFFQLGGDSIISIQIVARAREAGLYLTLNQLFHNQTIAQLAAVATTEAAACANDGTLEGDFPLTPIQRWFFEDQPVDPHHFNHSALVEVPPGLDAAMLAQTTVRLVFHHDALRLRFRQEDGRWLQSYDTTTGTPLFRVVDLRTVATQDLRARVRSECEAAQTGLNLQSGPIAQFVWFDLGDRPGRLLVVIHHLAIDAVSWTILMEDFWRAYESLARGEALVLPAKTSSFRQWANRLSEFAQTPKLQRELPYWLAAVAGASGKIPLDAPGGENLASAVGSVTAELDEESTRSLLQDVPKAYRTQINDALLTALAQALGTWIRENKVRFDLEGHGREPLFDDVDLTRTVGWFTTIFPVTLEVPADNPGEALKAVKEQLHQVPHRGLSYGLLRYVSPESGLSNSPASDVAFNYLGQVAALPDLEPVGPPRSPRARRRHLIEVNAEITSGHLRVHWEFSEHHHRRTTVEQVAGEFISRLRALVEHCRSMENVGFTPSDFAQAGITQKDLDKVIAAVERSARQSG
jgi:amino acid adenylation domain-containing protein/non-ribosomal peptide synthase protein (TIGR01720 family)